MINYTIAPHAIANRLLAVDLSFTHSGGSTRLTLPDWIPGSYLVRDFSKHIHSIHVVSAAKGAWLEAVAKSTWQLTGDAGPVVIQLVVYANDLSVRASYLDDQRAFINPTSMCLQVAGQAHVPHRLLLRAEDWPASWQVATGLPAESVDARGMGHYIAPSFSALSDYPIEVGVHQHLEFSVQDVVHHVVLSGECCFDQTRLIEDLQAICGAQMAFFASPNPVSGYWFLINVVSSGYGGLEHLNSTALIISREQLPAPGAAKRSEGYIEFLGLCSHEYFHTWNVKRIRPRSLMPYDFSGPQYTDMLWFAEGVTSHYDEVFLYRAGLIDLEQYLQRLAKTATRVERAPGQLTQTLFDASFSAWTKFYQQDENAPNTLASYYQKGALLALCLDLCMRRETAGKASLDRLMLAAWAEANTEGYAGIDTPWVLQFLQAQGAPETADALMRWLSEPVALPLAALLATKRIDLQRCVDQSAEAYLPSMGAYLGAGTTLRTVLHGGPAAQGGLSSGDEIVALDRLRLNKKQLHEHLARKADAKTEVHVFRHDRLLSFCVMLQLAHADQVTLKAAEDAELDWLEGDLA